MNKNAIYYPGAAYYEKSVIYVNQVDCIDSKDTVCAIMTKNGVQTSGLLKDALEFVTNEEWQNQGGE